MLITGGQMHLRISQFADSNTGDAGCNNGDDRSKLKLMLALWAVATIMYVIIATVVEESSNKLYKENKLNSKDDIVLILRNNKIRSAEAGWRFLHVFAGHIR
jgi:hypothetical protein